MINGTFNEREESYMSAKRMIAIFAVLSVLFTVFVCITAIASDAPLTEGVYDQNEADDAINPLTGDVVFIVAVVVAAASIITLYLIMRKKYVDK